METKYNTTFSVAKKLKRVAVYVRVSTDEQARDDKYGVQAQEEKVLKYCESQDHILKQEHIYRDLGRSGSLSISDREGLSKLFEAAKNKEFDCVVVYRTDRFFRKTSKLLAAVEELISYGVDFISATETFDTSNPNGRMFMQLLAVLGEHEKELIKERMTGGKLQAARHGKWVTGVPPYGYRVDSKTKTLVLHSEEAEVVKKFYEWLVYEKCSLREITRRAIELELPPPAHKSIDGKKVKTEVRMKGKWYKRTINRILVNEVYTGTFYYNKYKRPFKYLSAIDNEEHQRPKSEHIELQVPVIVSQEMFEKAIEQLKQNRSMQKRNEKRTYLFSGLLYSGYTGRKLQSGYQKPKKDIKNPTFGKYYHVYIPLLDRTNDEGQQNDTQGQCAESRLLPIWNTLVSILKDPENTIPQLEEYTFKNSNEARTVKKIAELDKQLETVKEQQQRIVRAYTDMGMGQDEYESQMKEKRSRQKELEVQKQKLSQTLLKKKEQQNRNEVIAKLFEKLQTKLDAVTYEQQQYILRLFVERITLFHKQNYAEVVFKFPVKTSVPNNVPAEISGDGQMRLVLHVKTKSEYERRQEILKSNPAMFKG